MIYQTDEEFGPEIRHFGCYFLSLVFQLDRLLSLGIMDHRTINAIYKNEQADYDIGPECYLQNPQGVCDHISLGRAKFLMKADSIYSCKPDEFEVQCWYNPNTDFHHFVAGDSGRVIYDPIRGGSRTVREGNIQSKRIFAIT